MERGVIAHMRLITDELRSRQAFADWAVIVTDGKVGTGAARVPGQYVWIKANNSPAGVNSQLGVDAAGNEWSVEINAPPQPGDHNRLSAIAEDDSGGLHLLRQGWLRGRRSAPDVREAEFAQVTGLREVPVAASGRAAARRWFLVASLDDPPERIRRTTARFVERCHVARGADTLVSADDGKSIGYVTDLDAVLANVATLDAVRESATSDDHAAYLSLIKRGTCFLPYATADGIAFAPSRFIGYAGNSFARHAANEARDGRLTNGAINTILGQAPVPDPALETEYQRFCIGLGFTPSEAGTFGVTRKYWLTPDIRSRLDRLAEQAIFDDPALSVTQREQLIQARIGQGVFRDALLEHWGGRCCITDCAIRPVLRASHIKPWRASTNLERLDRFNGLLLTANVDALFDRFLISFSDAGAMLFGPAITRDDLLALGCDPDRPIALSAQHAPYLDWHRGEYRTRGGRG